MNPEVRSLSTSSSSDDIDEETNLNNGTVLTRAEDQDQWKEPSCGLLIWMSLVTSDATEGKKTAAVDVAGNLYSSAAIDDASVIEGTKWSSPTVVNVARNLYSRAAIDAASSGGEGNKYFLLV